MAFKVVYGCGHEFYSNSSRIATPCLKCGYPTAEVYAWDKEVPENAQIITSQLKFIGRVTSMGERFIIHIPRTLYPQIALLKGKEVIVTIDEMP